MHSMATIPHLTFSMCETGNRRTNRGIKFKEGCMSDQYLLDFWAALSHIFVYELICTSTCSQPCPTHPSTLTCFHSFCLISLLHRTAWACMTDTSLIWFVASVWTGAVTPEPLLKKPSLDPNYLDNFRPVSKLPFLCLLEKVVAEQLIAF